MVAGVLIAAGAYVYIGAGIVVAVALLPVWGRLLYPDRDDT